MDTPLSTIAVVGLGTMGVGIAEVLARAGRDVIGIDISETAALGAVASLEASTARAVSRGRITEQERTAALARFRTSDSLSAAADADLVIEVVPETYEIKQQVFRELDAVVSPHRDPGHRHQRPVGDPAGRRVAAPRARARPALLQPGARDEAGRGRLLGADRAARRRGRHRARPGAGQGAGRGRRPAGVRRGRAALRLPQPGRRDVRGELRLPRGHRRGDEAGLRAADGPPGAARPDRDRHRADGPGGHVRRVPRPAARPGARPRPAQQRRSDRAQGRARLLHVRRAGRPGRDAGRADPGGRRRGGRGARGGVGGRRGLRNHGVRDR